MWRWGRRRIVERGWEEWLQEERNPKSSFLLFIFSPSFIKNFSSLSLPWKNQAQIQMDDHECAPGALLISSVPFGQVPLFLFLSFYRSWDIETRSWIKKGHERNGLQYRTGNVRYLPPAILYLIIFVLLPSNLSSSFRLSPSLSLSHHPNSPVYETCFAVV